MSSERAAIKLEDLGYDIFFATSQRDLGVGDLSVARVIAEHKGVYRVKGLSGEYLAKITGHQRFNAKSREDFPAVGDWVAITVQDNKRVVINKILARKTLLRKEDIENQETQVIAANVDVALIVESVDRDYNLNRLERYLVLVRPENIKPVIILNKIDLISEEEASLKIKQIKDRFNNIEVFSTSAVTDQGVEELVKYIVKGLTYCFLGSSGVGKSSLINQLLGQEIIATNELSYRTGRGQHTTTSRELYLINNGGIVIDNPGMREVGIGDASEGVAEVFADIVALSPQCKYSDCTHKHEPGCAVLKAINAQALNEQKYANYIKLTKETAHYALSNKEKRAKDRKFGRFVKNTLEQINKIE